MIRMKISRRYYTSTFETLPPKNVVWDKNFSVRIEQAKQYTRPQITGGKYIDINLRPKFFPFLKMENYWIPS